jgi:hypothetical protein
MLTGIMLQQQVLLIRLSGLTPSGRNKGSITFAVKRRVIKGTPRINSINITHIDLIMGI